VKQNSKNTEIDATITSDTRSRAGNEDIEYLMKELHSQRTELQSIKSNYSPRADRRGSSPSSVVEKLNVKIEELESTIHQLRVKENKKKE
jgi:hypothetical protein